MPAKRAPESALPAMRAALHAWYKRHGRHHLPWRMTPDPYAIWISEVMLQQTLVATVLGRFYHPFLERFPTVQALAEADEESVMKAWEGLGYYRRARMLHQAAKQIVAHHGGVLPNNVETLLTLPGIGRNTAHAVASFGFNQAVPVMEANLKRVLARLHAWEKPTDDQLWTAATNLLDPKNSFDHNQAMMDIGAQICLPRKPLCLTCPFEPWCLGKVAPDRYPAPKIKKANRIEHRKILVAYRDGGERRYHLAKRETELLGGLYAFPQLPMNAESWDLPTTPFPLAAAKSLGPAKHIYTHFTLISEIVALDCTATTLANLGFYTLAEIHALPLSGIDRQVLRKIETLL